MAVIGRATVTLTQYRDIQSVTRYYKLRPAGSSAPLKPETKPPSSDWTDSEPACDISKELYFCDLTIFSNGEWEYSKVSKSTSYEASKQAYNKADNAQKSIDNLEIGGRNLLPDTDFGGASKKHIVPDGVVEGSGGEGGFQFTPTIQIESGIEYTLSLRMRGHANINFYEINTGGNLSHRIARRSDLSETDYKKISYTFVVRADRTFQRVYICTAWGQSATGDWFEIEPKSLKLEKGNKATDWTPAPEDVDAGIDNAQTAADNAQTSADSAASAAANAQTTADTAKTNAATAQSTADTAKANAATAQSTADTAKSKAEQALEASSVTTETLKAESARIDSLETGKANIADLNAEKARIDTLETNKANIDLANVNNAWITNGVIKDASIANEKVISVSANKLTAGTIDASKIIVTNLNADNITVGTINGARIGNNSIDLNKLSQEVPTKEYLDSVEQKLQGEIDGAIETFTVSEIPTLNNEPAVNWTTDNIKSTHVGDLCYVVNNASDNDGFCYRFQYNGTVYSWALIKDNDVTKAIQDIAELGGEVTQFKTDYTSKVSEIDGGIESLKSRTTTIETTYSTKTYTDNKASDALTSANSYADNKASSTLTEANSYADNKASTTLSSAKTYADNTASSTLTSANDYADGKANKALTDANKYTDNTASSTLTSANTYSDNKASDALTSANSYADTKASSTLTDAKSYTDSTASNTLGEAKSYTDTATADMATTGDIPTKVSELTNDSSFATTTQVSTAKSEAISTASADATSKANSALDSAKSYTDAIEIGGRNLLKQYISAGNGCTKIDNLTVQVGTDAGDAYFYLKSHCDLTAGETYTISCEASNVPDGCNWSFGVRNQSSEWQLYINKNGKNFATGILDANVNADTNIILDDRYGRPSTAPNIILTNFKLEKGNRATDWTPAPEDVNAGIANAQTTANEAKAKAEAAQTAVSTKVETSVFNTLKNTVDENSANITSLTETVTTKADSSTVTTLSNTVNEVKQTADENSSSISSLTTTVNSKADGSKVTALETKTSTIEQNLSGVATRVTNLESENDGLDTRLTTAESKITDDAIVSTVTSSKTYKDALSGKVDTSVYNTKMQQLDDSISLKATATDVYTKTQANAALATAKSEAISSANSYTDTATTDMATQEFVTSQGYLTVTSDAITSKVSKNEVISAIIQSPESVSISAEKINLKGAVTFSSFDNSLQTTINNKAETSELEGVRTVATNAATVATNFMSYNDTDGLIVGNKTGGSFVGSRAQVLPDSFNILNTDGTKRASFGETTIIGDTNKANLYLTYNELYMEDKDDKVFFKVGDYRGSTGVATLTYTDTRSVNVSAGRVYVALSIPAKIESVISVVVEGTTISEGNYRFSIIDETLNGEVVDHTTSMWVEGLTYKEGDKVEVEVTYTTKSPYSYYVFGLPDKSLIPGRFSSSEGWCTRASGEYTHAEGRRSLASGYASHAEGSSYAHGYMSHAEGISTANGTYSHAEGNSTTGKDANFSHAEGNNTVASSESQHVSGAFNIIDNDGKYVFIIGNGSGLNSRSNAMTVDWNGVPTFYGMAGEIKMWAGDTIPTGWLLCDGSEVSKTDYPNLYKAIGDLWGTPNSSSNFKLPNLTGRVPVGYNAADTDTTETFGKVGATGGARGAWYHTHTIGSSGAHHHATQGRTEGSGTGANIFESYNGASKTRSVNVPRTGDNGAHTHSPGSSGSSGNKLAVDKANMPPYAVVKYIICAF